MIISPMDRNEEYCLKFVGTAAELKQAIEYLRLCCCPICGVEVDLEYYKIGLNYSDCNVFTGDGEIVSGGNCPLCGYVDKE